MKTIILAGGKGTRISSVAPNIPKPMLRINEKPVLEYEIDCLREQGLTDLIITVGHLGSKITDYFGDGSGVSPATGRPFGVNIEYFAENEPLGNAGALLKLKDRLSEDFLVLNGDLVFDVDFQRMIEFHKRKKAIATLFTHPNSHPYDSGIVVADKNNSVVGWLSKDDIRPEWYRNRVNAGIHILSPCVFNYVDTNGKMTCDADNGSVNIKADLDRDILKPLVGTGRMFCYDSPEYVRDMGTPERYRSVCGDFCNNRIKYGDLSRKRRAIFLDRDGTLNKHTGYLRNVKDFELIENTSRAIKAINNSEYLAVVVTNQPVIARGEVTWGELDEIHNKMETLLGHDGAYINALYYCPHHPDKGYDGEITELKIRCKCRKPNPGMLFKAAEELNIDLSNSWMIGDSKNDILAGKNAGCKTALIGRCDFGQDISVKSLFEFTKQYL